MSEENIEEQNEKWENVKKEVERLMSLNYMANTPTFVAELDEEGYMSIDYLLTIPSLQQLNINENYLIDIIKSIPSLSLSADYKSVRISLPVAKKTVIIRDALEITTEESIRSLLKDFAIESVKKEIGNSWFISLDTEKTAMEVIDYLALYPLDGQMVKARVKSEYYMKVFMKHLQTIHKPSLSTQKLSISATPFTPKEPLPLLSTNLPENQSILPQLGSYWDDSSYSQLNFDYYPMKEPIQSSSVPFVVTSPIHQGYTGSYIHYSPEEILAIVRGMKDQSLPPLATPGDHSIAIDEFANVELVEKGRTMSIDQAFNIHPRTLSVDSIDYTNMLTGEIDEEIVTYVRKQRKHRNRRRSSVNSDRSNQSNKGKNN